MKWHAAMLAGDAAARRPGPLALGKEAFVGDMWKHIWKIDDDGVPRLWRRCAGEPAKNRATSPPRSEYHKAVYGAVHRRSE